MSCQKCTFLFFFLVTVVAPGALAAPPQRIVGGTFANPGEFPHAVSLRVGGLHFCGGSIIGPQHILTAAHCVHGIMVLHLIKNGLTIVSGTNSLSRGGHTHRVKRATSHPDFQFDTKKSFPNDIAVITLMAPMDFNSYQEPIKLASRDSYQGTQGIIIGWGFSTKKGTVSEFLRKLYPTVHDVLSCRAKLFTNMTLPSELVCAVLPKGMGACSGDSGGSLVVNGELIGVASFIIPTCANGYPDFYTKVFAYKSFIDEEMLQT